MIDENDEEMRQRLKTTMRRASGLTREDVRAMSDETLRDYFERGVFPVGTSWEELLLIRDEAKP